MATGGQTLKTVETTLTKPNQVPCEILEANFFPILVTSYRPRKTVYWVNGGDITAIEEISISIGLGSIPLGEKNIELTVIRQNSYTKC